MPLAKGLGSGVPIGACVVGGRAKGVFKPGNHGSTFGGNPLAMRAGVDDPRTIKEESLLAQRRARRRAASAMGSAKRSPASTGVAEVRGMGLMIGIELDRPCGELVSRR